MPSRKEILEAAIPVIRAIRICGNADGVQWPILAADLTADEAARFTAVVAAALEEDGIANVPAPKRKRPYAPPSFTSQPWTPWKRWKNWRKRQ